MGPLSCQKRAVSGSLRFAGPPQPPALLQRLAQGLPSLAALGWGLRETQAMHISVCCWRASSVLPSLLPWEVRELWK